MQEGRISSDDLYMLNTAHEHLKHAQCAVGFAESLIAQKYQISMGDSIDSRGFIHRKEARDDNNEQLRETAAQTGE